MFLHRVWDSSAPLTRDVVPFTRSAGRCDMNAPLTVGLLMDAMIVVGRIRRLRLCLHSRSCHALGLSSRLGILIPVVDQRLSLYIA
ncbi:hypothetical protein BDZ89DRAFT_81301 [Hymenopellis radicata]|nr:hypothetical protein BDZ89DRAFT_81301 [Hymenopellis radicata]